MPYEIHLLYVYKVARVCILLVHRTTEGNLETCARVKIVSSFQVKASVHCLLNREQIFCLGK